MSKDYHDYVIKDGKLIGEFDAMYKECENPWDQKDVWGSYSKMSSIASLHRIGAKKVLEVGCGLGYYSFFMKTLIDDIKVTGIDISETAIKKARETFRGIDFRVGSTADIKSILAEGGYDAVIFSEVFWYILDQIDTISTMLKEEYKNMFVIVNQTFYNGGQKYGREYFTTPAEMINYLNMECLSLVTESVEGIGKGYSSHALLKV